MPKTAQWSLTSLREKLIKIGAKAVNHSRYVTFAAARCDLPLRKPFRGAILALEPTGIWRMSASTSPPITRHAANGAFLAAPDPLINYGVLSFWLGCGCRLT